MTNSSDILYWKHNNGNYIQHILHCVTVAQLQNWGLWADFVVGLLFAIFPFSPVLKKCCVLYSNFIVFIILCTYRQGPVHFHFSCTSCVNTSHSFIQTPGAALLHGPTVVTTSATG